MKCRDQQSDAAVNRRYTFKLYPTPEQAAALHEQRMMCVDLWNALLQRHEDIYRRTRGQRGVLHSEDRSSYTFFDMTSEITQMRRECPEWAALSVWSAHGVADSLAQAFTAFYRRAKAGAGAQSGYPKYRRRASGANIPHRHNLPPWRKSGSGSGCKLEPRIGRNWTLCLKGVEGPIHARGLLPIAGEEFNAANVIWRDGRWWFSICCEMKPRRIAGLQHTLVHFDLLDGMAIVNGRYRTPLQIRRASVLRDRIDAMKSERDRRWPKRAPQDREWREATDDINRLISKERRVRHNALHVWSTRVVQNARSLNIKAPRMSDHIASGKGDAMFWGAAVGTVADLNRHALSFACASAVAMLRYKAEEAGIRCEIEIDQAPKIAVGEKLVAAGKQLRKTKRALQEKYNERNQQRVVRSGRGDRGSVSTGG